MSVPFSILNGMDRFRFSAINPTVKVVVINDKQSFANLAGEWEDLLRRTENSNIYQTHNWLYTWWHWFGELTSSELSIICVYSGKSLIAIAPFYYICKPNIYGTSKKYILCLLGQPETQVNFTGCEQLDIIIDAQPYYQDMAIKNLSQYFTQSPCFSRLIFHKVTKGSLLYRLVQSLPNSHTSGLNHNETVQSISLPATFNAFVNEQTHRWQVNYHDYLRLMESAERAEIRRSNTPENIHAGLQSLALIMCTQQRKRSSGNCSFDAEHYMRFHEDVCHLLSVKGHVEIVSLMMEGRLLASIYYYQHQGMVQIYKMASVRGDGIHFSPLFLLLVHVVKQAIKEKKTRIDFLSDCRYSELEQMCFKKEQVKLYTLQWYRNLGQAYLNKTINKLNRTLRTQTASL